MYYVKYRLNKSKGEDADCRSGPFEERKTAEAFVVAFINRNQVLWIHIIEEK